MQAENMGWNEEMFFRWVEEADGKLMRQRNANLGLCQAFQVAQKSVKSLISQDTEKFLRFYVPWLSLQMKYYSKQLICTLLFINSLLEVIHKNLLRSWISFRVPWVTAFENSIERRLIFDTFRELIWAIFK